jgi:hypothetical protein
MGKEPDLHWRSRLLKSFVLMFGPFHIIGFIYHFHILWATLATVVCAPLAVWVAERVGERSVILLYGLGGETFHRHERLAGELDKIRHCKRQKDFDRALYLVNQVIDKAPDLPEALFLKAQILWEGFGNVAAAERHLEKVIQLVDEKEPLHQWVLSYQRFESEHMVQ